MVTLQELMEITAVDHLTVYAPGDDGTRERLDVYTEAEGQLARLIETHGQREVKTVWPMYKGDVRMVVEVK